MRCGYLRVSTASGEQLAALENQRFQLETQGVDLMLEDVESGLEVSRPGYQQLRTLVGEGRVREVIATQFSRLGRDADEADNFVRLCDQHGAKVRTLAEGVLTMASADEWFRTRLASTLSQQESLRLGERVRSGYRAGRLRQRPMRKPPWGYRINRDRSALELDPIEAPRAKAFLRLLWGSGCRMATALKNWEGDIPLKSQGAVKLWLLNPILRGGIGYRRIRGNQFREIHWDVHPPLISHAQVEEFERVLAINRLSWGASASHVPRLLTGLCRCRFCGNRMAYASTKGRWLRMLCRTRGCSRWCLGLREHLVRAVLVETLRQRGRELAELVAVPDPPEVLSLRARLEALEALNEPMAEEAILQLRRQLEQLRSRPAVAEEDVEALSDPRLWEAATDEELRVLALRFVDTIWIGQDEVTGIDLRL